MVDSHAHLFSADFGQDLNDILNRARAVGIRAIVIPGTNAETSREAVQLARGTDWLHACVGVHPHEAAKADEAEFRAIEELSALPDVVAIGEIGLDFFYDFSPRDVQARVFMRQIDLAVKRDLPIVVHTRDSIPEALEIVRAAVRDHPAWCGEGSGAVRGRRGVFHCFTGSAEQARELFSLGFFVSYPGIVTFKNSPVVAPLKEIGYGNILLETDAPYLAPVPHRGTRNEPSHLPLVAETVARIVGAETDEVIVRTSQNAARLFGRKVHVGTTQHL